MSAGTKPSWTARLLADPTLLCKKVSSDDLPQMHRLPEDEWSHSCCHMWPYIHRWGIDPSQVVSTDNDSVGQIIQNLP